MKITPLPEAEMEMLEAARYYEGRRRDLGVRFLSAVDNAIRDIEKHPRRGPVIRRRFRRLRLADFPYGVVYSVRRSEIIVVAIMHLHRNPRYWMKRI
jgi:toxin ParE1/3/4